MNPLYLALRIVWVGWRLVSMATRTAGLVGGLLFLALAVGVVWFVVAQ